MQQTKVLTSELGTFEWWISGLRLDPLFFLISRLNNACSILLLLISRLINRSGLRIPHSKVFSSGQFSLFCIDLLNFHHFNTFYINFFLTCDFTVGGVHSSYIIRLVTLDVRKMSSPKIDR